MTANLQIICYHSIIISLCPFQLIKWEHSCYSQFTMSEHEKLQIVYKRSVLDRTRDDIVLKFGSYEIPEYMFVDCFKPTGLMHSKILYLVCELWSEHWDDTIILSEFAVVSTYPRTQLMDFFMLLFFTYDCRLLFQNELVGGSGTQSLEKDLTPEKVRRAKKVCALFQQICVFHCYLVHEFDSSFFFQIYIPIVVSGHISLVVVSITTKKTYILDSWPKAHEKVANDVLATLQ